MKSIFNINKNTDNYTLSTEMIDIQQNDYIVNVLNEEFKQIIELVKSNNITDANDAFRNRTIYKIMSKIDVLITKRFGINFKHTAGFGFGYACFTVPPKNKNILNTDIEKTYNATNDMLRYSGKREENFKTKDTIKYVEKDYLDLSYRWKQSMDSLEKTMNTKGVIIDLRKANIIGLPAEYIVFLVVDLYGLIIDLELNEEELTAVLLHEIGHAFTHIEYSYRTITNTSVLLDSLKENIQIKNKTFKESLIIAYEEAYDEKLDDIKNKNSISATLYVIDRYIASNIGFNQQPHGLTDSEQLADQFAGRFGVAPVLSNALTKIYKKYPGYLTAKETFIMLSVPMLIFFLYGIIISGVLAGGVVLSIGFLISVIVIKITNSIVSIGGLAIGSTYDENKRRIQRIRNEMVRQLRSDKLSKEVLVSTLEQIEQIDLTLKSMPEDNIGFVDKLMRKYTSTGKRLTEFKQIEQLVENLMENDLHVVSNKLKQLA